MTQDAEHIKKLRNTIRKTIKQLMKHGVDKYYVCTNNGFGLIVLEELIKIAPVENIFYDVLTEDYLEQTYPAETERWRKVTEKCPPQINVYIHGSGVHQNWPYYKDYVFETAQIHITYYEGRPRGKNFIYMLGNIRNRENKYHALHQNLYDYMVNPYEKSSRYTGVRRRGNAYLYRIKLKLPNGSIHTEEKGGFPSEYDAYRTRSKRLHALYNLETQEPVTESLSFDMIFARFLKTECAEKTALRKKIFYTV